MDNTVKESGNLKVGPGACLCLFVSSLHRSVLREMIRKTIKMPLRKTARHKFWLPRLAFGIYVDRAPDMHDLPFGAKLAIELPLARQPLSPQFEPRVEKIA